MSRKEELANLIYRLSHSGKGLRGMADLIRSLDEDGIFKRDDAREEALDLALFIRHLLPSSAEDFDELLGTSETRVRQSPR